MIKDVIYFAKVNPEAKIPNKREEDACYDIYPCFAEKYRFIKPHETVIIPTGIASACSDEYFFHLLERGSTGSKGMGQRCGVIDSGYRGEWFVPITNHNDKVLIVIKECALEDNLVKSMCNELSCIIFPYEKAICQAALSFVPKVIINEISYDDLNSIESKRGIGRLGSSGK